MRRLLDSGSPTRLLRAVVGSLLVVSALAACDRVVDVTTRPAAPTWNGDVVPVPAPPLQFGERPSTPGPPAPNVPRPPESEPSGGDGDGGGDGNGGGHGDQQPGDGVGP